MLQSILDYISSPGLIPHGYCLAWSPALLWTLVGAHTVIALAYYSIPIALLRFVKRTPGLTVNWVFVMFGMFIFACGTTHVIAIMDIWVPAYRLDGAAMLITAGLSAATAVMIWPLMPVVSARLHAETAAKAELNAINLRLSEALPLLEQKNRQIEENERRFRMTIEGTPIGLAIVSLEGRWLVVNRALCQMLGYSEQEMLKKSFQDITHPHDLERDMSCVRELLAGRASSYEIEKRYITASGEELQVQLNASLLRDVNGKPLHFISQIQDITRRKQAEAELQRQHHEITVLSELNGVLQSCISLEEIGLPISQACRKLFPESSGAAYLINASRNYLESLAEWGDKHCSEALFAPDDCWALRRGQTLSVNHTIGDGISCKHIHRHGSGVSMCVPMTAQSELIGMLYLEVPVTVAGKAFEDMRAALERHANLVAERVSIAVANLKLRDKLSYQSMRDPLTGLFNRRHLEDVLPRDLARAEREKSGLAVMMIDIDHFKNFNDTHGHEAGDVALTAVARQIEGTSRQGDVACRFGGEEFALVMTHVTQAQALARAKQLCEKVRRLELVARGKILKPATISIGLAMYPDDGASYRGLIDAADRALYRAKHLGRDQVVLADEAPGEDAQVAF